MKKTNEKLASYAKNFDLEKNNDIINLNEKRYLNIDEACAYLGISRRLMNDLTCKKKVKYALLGGRKFKREWLDEFVDRQTVDCIL